MNVRVQHFQGPQSKPLMKVFARYILNSMPNRTALAPPFHEINITDALQSQPMIVHSGDKHNKNNYLWTSDNTKHLIPNGKTLRRMKKQHVFVDFLPKAVLGAFREGFVVEEMQMEEGDSAESEPSVAPTTKKAVRSSIRKKPKSNKKSNTMKSLRQMMWNG